MSLIKKILAGFSLLTHPAKVRHTPIQANIEVTNSCNLDCIMCDRANTIGKGDMMSLDTFKSVIDQVNPSTVNLSGNGEPLLNKHVYSMIHYAKTKGIHTQMTSNFTGVSAKAQEICQSGLDFLKVSIDGTQDETFQTVRGVVLDKIIEGIEELARVRETSNRETPLLRINMVVLDVNAGELEAMVELAYKHSIDSVQYKWCQTFNLQKEEVTGGITVEDMNKEIEQAKATSKRLGISTNLHLLKNEIAIAQSMKDSPPSSQGAPTCVAPWTWIYIDVHGKVYPCCYYAYRQNELPFGNIHQEHFDLIWNGKTYQEFRYNFGKRTRTYDVCKFCVAPTLSEVLSNYGNIHKMIKV